MRRNLGHSDRVFYVVMVDGVPMAVTTISANAKSWAAELDTVNRQATVIPTYALDDTTDDFEQEEDTIRTDDRPEL